MNNQMHTESALSGVAKSSGAPARYRGGGQAAELLMRLFRRYPDALTLRLWDGTSIRAGAARIESKIAANAVKYPVEKAKGRSAKYTEL